jgi:hypothetical protein
MGSGTAAAFGSIAIGWHRLLADAAGSLGKSDSSVKPAARSAPDSRPDAEQVVEVPPAEEIVLLGTVLKPTGPASFIGSSKRFSNVSVDVSVADPVYPKNHVPRKGDDFAARGRWLGAVGDSTFQVEFVDYNIRRVRGRLATTGLLDTEADYTVRDVATGKTWQLVVRPENIEHLTAGQTAPQPTEATLAFVDGTGVDIIGYEARPNVIVVTWIET